MTVNLAAVPNGSALVHEFFPGRFAFYKVDGGQLSRVGDAPHREVALRAANTIRTPGAWVAVVLPDDPNPVRYN